MNPVSRELETFKTFFYQCQFDRVLSHPLLPNSNTQLWLDVESIRSNALMELGRVEASREKLRSLVEFARPFETLVHSISYTLGRLSYMTGDYVGARKLFGQLRVLAGHSETEITIKRKALLGLLNIAYTTEAWGDFEILMEEARRMHSWDLDEELSLELLRGHYANFKEQSLDACLQSYFRVYQQSTAELWTYYQKRALYFVALAYQRLATPAVMEPILKLLQNAISPSVEPYLCQLVDKRFAHSDVLRPLTLDARTFSIELEGKTWSLADSPQIYRFIECLDENDRFVSKREIAAQLWPNQTYSKYIHDPRIFDLAKRFRKVLEKEQCQRISLISGRNGYRLISERKAS